MSEYTDRQDASLAARGENILLRRTTGPNKDEVEVRAHVRSYRMNADELARGIYKQPYVVIITLTQITAAGWPQHAAAPLAPPFDVDPRVPVIGDVAIVKGGARTVKAVDPVAVNDEIVRVKMIVDG